MAEYTIEKDTGDMKRELGKSGGEVEMGLAGEGRRKATERERE